MKTVFEKNRYWIRKKMAVFAGVAGDSFERYMKTKIKLERVRKCEEMYHNSIILVYRPDECNEIHQFAPIRTWKSKIKRSVTQICYSVSYTGCGKDETWTASLIFPISVVAAITLKWLQKNLDFSSAQPDFEPYIVPEIISNEEMLILEALKLRICSSDMYQERVKEH